MHRALLPMAALLAAPAFAQADGPDGPFVVEQTTPDASSPRWIWGPDFVPDVNLYGNFIARKETGFIYDEEGNEVSDIARIRQVDVILGFPIAEGMTALVDTSLQSDPGNTEFFVEFEQAYVEFTRFPLIGDFTDGLSILVGQFRSKFGRLNRELLFDVPHIERPQALQTFFGERGWSQSGMTGRYEIPLFDAGRVVLDAEYMDSGSTPLGLENGGSIGGNNLRASWVSDEGARHGLELGISQLHTRRADVDGRRASVTGFDALYHWRPREDEAPLFWFGGELLEGDVDVSESVLSQPQAYYLWTQLRIDETWYVGARYDVTDELEDDTLRTKIAGLYLTWMANPFARLSIGVLRSSSDIAVRDDVTRVLVEFNLGAGTNPSKPFWLE